MFRGPLFLPISWGFPGGSPIGGRPIFLPGFLVYPRRDERIRPRRLFNTYLCGKRESIKCQCLVVFASYTSEWKKAAREIKSGMYSRRKHKRRERTPHKTNAQYLATDGVVKILRLARGCETDNDRNNREYKCQQSASVHFVKRFLVKGQGGLLRVLRHVYRVELY